MNGDIPGPTPEQLGTSKISLDYNRYQSRDGTPNQDEIRRLEQAFFGKEVKERWNATTAEISDEKVHDGRLSVGEHGLSFDTKQLAMGMMASAEPAKLGDQDVIKLKYPHLKSDEVDSVSELYLTRPQFDKLRGVLRTDLEDQGLLDKKAPPQTLAEHIAETERLARKTNTDLTPQQVLGDNNQRIYKYEELLGKILPNVDFKEWGGTPNYASALHRPLGLRDEKSKVVVLKIYEAALATAYAFHTDPSLREQFLNKSASIRESLAEQDLGGTFNFFFVPDSPLYTEETKTRNTPKGTIEARSAYFNLASFPQQFREFVK